MKKVLSTLVACALTLSMGVATYAADDRTGTANADSVVDRSSRISGSTSAGGAITYTLAQNEMFLVANGSTPRGVYERLDPDEEYKFDVYYATAAVNNDTAANVMSSAARLTGEQLGGGDLKIRTVKGSSGISSVRIKKSGRGNAETYQVVINTKASYGTKITEAEYRLVASNINPSAGGTPVPALANVDSTFAFEVGYEPISDDELDIDEGGIITISNDYPVIEKEQFNDLAKNVNYKSVEFEADDGGWRYTGRVSGMRDTNFYFDYDVFPELIDKAPNQDYKFLTFRAGVTFPSAGEMRIDVDDIVDSFGGSNQIHTYLYRNGELTAIDTTFDSSSREIVFRTNYLGAFVMTDAPLEGAVNGGDTGEEPGEEPAPEPEPEEPGTGGNGGNNPNTGASSSMNLVVTLGLVSLATAGAVSRKRK